MAGAALRRWVIHTGSIPVFVPDGATLTWTTNAPGPPDAHPQAR
ncbi:TPA: hypothetical protein ACUI58_003678 [Klebsiella pneumoniae]|nr:hypothetical protein [Klebsiella pneumoniae]AFQ63555.1 hypothetical protein A79E_0139 [Klebsiella pneumoniae subsp. pneumoniae 1084]MDH8551195.1 hypothetical protein [Klebsiella pneumoniae]MDY2253777.1 hypothetical protein [Klebsiella pneumoniae]